MSKSGQLTISKTRSIPQPNAYVKAIYGEFREWSLDEEATPQFKGQWREKIFNASAETPLDLEIGVGNGLHFAARAQSYPNRCLLGVELRYKPLIQSIRRALREGSSNARVARYNAYLLESYLAEGEIDDVFIFFPDPWEKGRQHKHRLIQDDFLKSLYRVMRPGSRLLFKTDSADYFAWSTERFKRSPFHLQDWTSDLHGDGQARPNFITQFERIFIRQGLKIGYAELLRN
ncbi:MAG: tRNA (guanosine(46)-N7)-methyltransferase TrmB [Bdellovibrionales bacterium]